MKRAIAVAIVLLAVAAAAFFGRRAFIRSFFVDGAPGEAPLPVAPDDAIEVSPAKRVRVVLIDGLGRAVAAGLPNLSGACERGADLVVDNGFPTVSLPVQHVLWTGRTQAESGIMYRIEGLETPPAEALPPRVLGSIAVAESHPEIADSFGFESVTEPAREAFADDAAEVVSSPAQLAFVHILRVDEAGHATGAASSEYKAAAQWSDDLLMRLIESDPDPAGTRWFVLSDHGHLPAGGHAGSEPDIRLVRACIFGGPPLWRDESLPKDPPPIHLSDFHHALAASLGRDGPGRPLLHATKHPLRDQTLPRPSRLAWVVALALFIAGGIASARGATKRMVALPWWILAGYAATIIVHGVPTLSSPTVYPPTGTAMMVPIALGLPLILVAAWRSNDPLEYAIGQLAFPLAATAAVLILAGMQGAPPLVPLATAHTSWALIAVTLGAATAAVAVLARLALRR